MKWIVVGVVLSAAVTVGIAVALWMQAEREEFETVRVPLRINNTTWSVRVANTTAEHQRGLQGVGTLGEREGMIFIFNDLKPRSVWMKDMAVELDVVWVVGGKVIGVTEDVLPQPDVVDDQLTIYRSPQPIDSFVEISRGQARALGIAVGDSVAILNSP